MDSNKENELLKNKIKNLEAEVKNLTTKKALSKDESIFKKILEHSTNAFYSHTPDHELTYLSSQAYNILGYTPDEVMIKWTKLASDSPLNDEGFRKTVLAIETGEAQPPYELELIHKSGRKVYVEVHEAPVVENGETVAIVGALTDITNQKIAGTGLKESEKKFELLFEKSLDPILIIDGYNFVECNEATVKILGFKNENEICNVHPSKLSPEYQPDGQKSITKAKEMMDIAYNKGYNRFEWIHTDTTGKEFYMDVALTKIPYKGKDMIFTIWRDISKQKEFEQSIIENEKRFSSLFEQAADGILVGIKGGEIIEANESMVELTGYKKEELIGFNIEKLFEKEMLSNKPLRYDLVKKGDTVIRERNIIRKDGKAIAVEMNTRVLEDGRMQALFRDLSKRKEAECALRESEEKYRNIFHNSPLGILHYDISGVITDCNDHFVNIIGSSKQVLIGLNMTKDLKDEKVKNAVKKSLEKGESYFEDWYTSVTANKTTFVRILFKSIKDENNKIIAGIGLIEDITKRKEAEQNQKLSEEKFRLLYENSNDAILVLDKDIFIDCNEKTLKMFKCSRNQIVGTSPYLISPEYQPDGKKSKEKVLEILKEVLAGKSVIFEWVNKRPDGTEFYAEVSLNKFEYQNEVVIQAIVRDISERKELEQKIFNAVTEAEENERQRLASDIHDEIGPLLSGLKMYIESINENNDIQKQRYLKGQLQSLIKESIENVREVSNALSPYLLRKYGLKIATKSFFENSKEIVKVSIKTNLNDERFPINIETVYFRIIKELFNNTIKHAKAEKVNISLNYTDEKLILIYEDNGIGIKKEDFKKLEKRGIGLFNITNRILSIHGNYNFFPNKKKGFKFQMIKEIKIKKK
ncbi:MAG: PAS domain S-box protein [Bacteroidales bacterium]|nr:PAS domain S-box protein [Bacteroidales bacterium]